jgi:putative chitinase
MGLMDFFRRPAPSAPTTTTAAPTVAPATPRAAPAPAAPAAPTAAPAPAAPAAPTAAPVEKVPAAPAATAKIYLFRVPTFAQMTKLCPKGNQALMATLSRDGYDILAGFGVANQERFDWLLAQLLEESDYFQGTRENLNYRTPGSLIHAWPSRFPTRASEQPYLRNPEALANKVYSNRLGNGPAGTGDGWKFRGGFPIQLTGRETYSAIGKMLGFTADQLIAKIDDPAINIKVVGAYYKWKGLGKATSFRNLTYMINGGYTNYKSRVANLGKVTKLHA